MWPLEGDHNEITDVGEGKDKVVYPWWKEFWVWGHTDTKLKDFGGYLISWALVSWVIRKSMIYIFIMKITFQDHLTNKTQCPLSNCSINENKVFWYHLLPKGWEFIWELGREANLDRCYWRKTGIINYWKKEKNAFLRILRGNSMLCWGKNLGKNSSDLPWQLMHTPWFISHTVHIKCFHFVL